MKPIADIAALASAIVGLALSAPAAAAITVSYDQASFDSSHVVTTSYFSFSPPYNSVVYSYANPIGSYTLNGVSFSGSLLFASPSTGPVPTDPSVLFNEGTPLTISYSGSILGLALLNDGSNTIDYVINGTTSGTINFGGINTPVFLGIDTGGSGPVTITFSGGQADLNISSVQTGGLAAVPEPASWAMMIGGFGLAGAAMRRRRVSRLSLNRSSPAAPR